MRKRVLVLVSAITLVVAAQPAAAQSASEANQTRESAPPQSSHAAGHDAQSGRPATAASPEAAATTGRQKEDIGEANTAIAEEAEKQKK